MSPPLTLPAARFLTQPRVGIVTAGLAVLTLTVAWLPGVRSTDIDTGAQAVIAIILVAGVVLAYQFPLHIGYHFKIEVNTVPLYLMAVLLPPPRAATAAGLGILVAELAVRARRGSYPSDIRTAAGLFVIVILLGSFV